MPELKIMQMDMFIAITKKAKYAILRIFLT